MKRIHLLLFFLVIVLCSCNQSFYNNRQYANRNYIKIGPGIKKETLQVNKEENSTHFVRENEKPARVEQSMVASKVQPSFEAERNTKLETKTPTVIKNVVAKKQSHLSQQKPFKNHGIKKSKSTKETGILNILSFALGLIVIISMFVAFIYFLLALAEASLFAIGLAIFWACLGAGLVAILLGALGVGLGHPLRGLGMAGIVLASITVLIVLIGLLIIAVA